jgi:integrase/recombinase XerD
MSIDTGRLIQDFLDEIKIKDTTRENYKNMLEYWCEWLILNGITWLEARRPHVVRFIRSMEDKKKSGNYMNNYLSVLNKFYEYLFENELFVMNIAANIKRYPYYKGFRKKPLSFDQVNALLKSIDTSTQIDMRDSLVIRIMLISGLRCVEVSRLNIGDVDLNGQIPILMVRGKGKVDKEGVGISDDVCKDLKKYIGRRINRTDEPVFLVWEGCHLNDRMSAHYIGIMVKARMKAAGIDDKMISAHSLRHTCAVELLRNNYSLYDVQATLRHSNPSMTANYTRFLEAERRLNQRLPNRLEKFLRTRQQDLALNI